ncbi:unnamed protein product [Effrenium voratum]|nr:unnamed protein product [Effrenium voratum]
MGVPLNAAEARLPREPQSGRDLLGEPFRLQVESYEDFARLLPGLEQDQESRASVEEELRKLQIDPEIFYRNQSRLRVSGLPRELLDPAELSRAEGFAPPARAVCADPLDARDAHDAHDAPVPAFALKEEPCEEITLGGETQGGRLGHETPEGLSSRLQIDSLTDEGDEPDFRQELEGRDDEDLVEAFHLDPDFDYDNAQGSSKVAGDEIMPRPTRTDREFEAVDDTAEDAVEEP